MSSVDVLNGWTAPKLDRLNGTVETMRDHVGHLKDDVTDLKDDVADIKHTLKRMRDEEVTELRSAVKRRDEVIRDLQGRPVRWLLAFGLPVFCAVLGGWVGHAF